MKKILSLLCIIATFQLSAQSILPPVQDWHGKSESLIVKSNNPWITVAEQSDFVTTATYEETMNWFKKLAASSPLISMVSIGKSPEGREIYMIIASTDKNVSATVLKKSEKPLLLAQAGIHSGEIDGKDAGMMLLRDIAFGTEKSLLDKVNFLFIPILNVDGHERSSSYNRPNQRGPQNMGWRTNAQNLNLNRDYTKLDTDEVRAVVNVINEYDPLLYMDLHVTDGADYQYDITFGGLEGMGYSKSISNWLAKNYKNQADKDLKAAGHIPGQLLFTVNDLDFSQGNKIQNGGARFSDEYGDLRHTASVLVENHSLKPYKQRVLGTYVLLESTLKILANDGNSLKESTIADRNKRVAQLPMKFKVPQMDVNVAFENSSSATIKKQVKVAPDSLKLLGIEAKIIKSEITNSDYVQWTGKTETTTIANYKSTEAIDFVVRPKEYYIPLWCTEVIKRLKLHGIIMETLKESKVVTVEMYRIQDAKFQNESGSVLPFEGRMQVSGTAVPETRKETFPAGSVYISTDQTLGDLAMLLLEPKSANSFLSWGFFNAIFQRTEYIEAYIMEPTITKMLHDSPQLKKEFEDKKASDTVFANDTNAIYIWFYSKTKFYDEKYLLYPVGRAF
jgi:hypothetical protein